MSARLRSNEEDYAWECAENMRQWAIRAEATTKVWAARASAAEAVLRRIARECRHYDDFPEPCAACLAELGLTAESALQRTTPLSEPGFRTSAEYDAWKADRAVLRPPTPEGDAGE